MPYEKRTRASSGPTPVNAPQPQQQQPQQQQTLDMSGSLNLSRARRDSRASSSGSGAVCLDFTHTRGLEEEEEEAGGESSQTPNHVHFVDVTLRQSAFLSDTTSKLSQSSTSKGTKAVSPAASSSSALRPLFAAYTAKSSIYVLTLAFVWPALLTNVGTTHSGGLLQGALHASDAGSMVYLCYLALLLTVAPALGAVHDVSAPAKRLPLVHACLGGLCLGPILLLVQLSQTRVGWTGVMVVLGLIVVVTEMAHVLVFSHLVQLEGLPPRSNTIALLGNMASLVGLGLGTVLVGIPAQVAALALGTGPVAAARYACIATILVNLCATLYVVLVQFCLRPAAEGPTGRPRRGSGIGVEGAGSILHQQQQPPQQPSIVARLSPVALVRVLTVSPPFFLHFLLLRTFYQAGLRCLAYISGMYILQNLKLGADTVTHSMVLAFCAAVLGKGLTFGLLSARETTQAAHVGQHQLEKVASPSVGFGSSSLSVASTGVPAKTPLLIALAILTVVMAAAPTEVTQGSHTSLAFSKEVGVIYIVAVISGLCLGFAASYETSVLVSLLWPHGAAGQAGTVAGLGVGQLAGVVVAFGSVLEWVPMVLFAAFNQHEVHSSMWAFIPFFGLGFLLLVLVVLVERVRAGPDADAARHHGATSPADRPSLTKRMSFFLLRSLPSHLSTIAESPNGVTQSYADTSSSSSTAAAEDPLGVAAEQWRAGGGRGFAK